MTSTRMACSAAARWRSRSRLRFVGPLEVVEDEDDGLFLGHRAEQTDNGGEEQEPLGVGVGGLRGWQVAECDWPALGTSRDSSEPWASTWARSCSSGAWVT